MANKFEHSWHYQIQRSDNSFTLYFNDRLIAIFTKPSKGNWKIHATINDKTYIFSRKHLFQNSIQITEAMTGETLGFIKTPFSPLLYTNITLKLSSGEHFTWYNNNFFSLHWKWKKGGESIVDAVDNLSAKKHNGIIAIKEYKSGTDLLIIAGFLLSLIKSGKITMGIFRLKKAGEGIKQ